MKQLIIKILLFSILFFLIVKLSEKYFIKEDRFNFTNYTFNKVSDTLDFDILFFGSSKSYCSYNPTIFKNNLKVNAYNLAGQGQVLEVTNFVIDEVLKKIHPKLIVVDVSKGMIVFNKVDSISSSKKSYQLRIFDNFPLTYNKLKYIYKIYNKNDVLYTSSPLFRNHSQWIDMSEFNFKKNYLEGKNNLFLSNNGYIGTLFEIDKMGVEVSKQMNLGYNHLKQSNKIKVSDKEIEIIKEIKIKAEKKNIEVLFVSAPSIKGYVKHLSFYEDLEKISKKIGFNYLNLNKHFYDINLTVNDFKDIQHMNYSGGFKTSQYVSAYISDNYKFDKHAEINYLDNNVTYHLLNHLEKTEKILTTPFPFNEIITINEIGYFEESKGRYVFILKFKEKTTKFQLQNFRGYVRYYNKAIKEENKQVSSFPLKTLEVDNDMYTFVRLYIKNIDISKLDFFFMEKGASKASKFYTIKELKLLNNGIR
ncbi:MAG: hypothetical protein L3J14_03805 [Flavobacteriaceae bacterium]|nr:hypothetical protein [Flavobacteriaceae bacterium]